MDPIETNTRSKYVARTLAAAACTLVMAGTPPMTAAQPTPVPEPVTTKFFSGDTYSIHHLLGAEIDGVVQCFSVHKSGMDDNTVVFDGATELLDPYTNGDQPFIFEFEIISRGEGKGATEPSRTFSFLSNIGNDFFPEGFEDPETGTPLELACLEIGIDDTLDSDEPVEVVSAQLEFSNDSLEMEIFDLTDSLTNPWDGRLAFSAPNLVGRNMNGMILELTTTSSANIFADGFETGDTASWTERSP